MRHGNTAPHPAILRASGEGRRREKFLGEIPVFPKRGKFRYFALVVRAAAA
jgi:hypothetical protein